MARRVFFSFDFKQDIFRANQIRNANIVGVEKAGFYDHSEWDEVKRPTVHAIKRSILASLKDTTVTVVLIGTRTADRPWVRFEIGESAKRGNGFLGIQIHQLTDVRTQTGSLPGRIPDMPPGVEFPVITWGGNLTTLSREIEAAGRRAAMLRSNLQQLQRVRFWGARESEAAMRELHAEESRRMVSMARARMAVRQQLGLSALVRTARPTLPTSRPDLPRPQMPSGGSIADLIMRDPDIFRRVPPPPPSSAIARHLYQLWLEGKLRGGPAPPSPKLSDLANALYRAQLEGKLKR